MPSPLHHKRLRARAARRANLQVRPPEPAPTEPAAAREEAPAVPAPAPQAPPPAAAPSWPRMAAVDRTLLDEVVLGRLRQTEAMGAPGLLAATVQAFLARAPKRLEHLEMLSARPLRRELAQEAQGLAVNCASVGAVQLRQGCLTLAHAATHADATALQRQVEELREVLSRTAQALAHLTGA